MCIRDRINIESPEVGARLREMAKSAGFQGVLLDVVVTRLTQPAIKPTYVFDPAATAASQDAAAANVTAPPVTYPEGEVVYRRGDVLTAAQLEATRQAIAAELRKQSFNAMVGSRAAVMGLVAAIAAAMLGYAVLFVPVSYTHLKRSNVREGVLRTIDENKWAHSGLFRGWARKAGSGRPVGIGKPGRWRGARSGGVHDQSTAGAGAGDDARAG